MIPLEVRSEEGVIVLVYPVACILSDRSWIRLFNLCERERPIDMNNSYSNVTASKSYSLSCYNLANLNWYIYN